MAKTENEVKLSPEDKKWRAENDAKTLQLAEEIRNDKDRLKAAMKIMDEQMKAMQDAQEANMAAMPDKMFSSMKKKEG